MRKTKIYHSLLLGTSITLSVPVAAQHWTHVPSPNISTGRNVFTGISGSSANDIWAVGDYDLSPDSVHPYTQNLLMHWNGNAWQTFTAPAPATDGLNGLNDVTVVSHTEAWAVGFHWWAPASRPQLLKWNGTSWSQQAIPNMPATAFLNRLKQFSPANIWAVGRREGTPQRAYVLRYNGSSWSELHVPPIGTRWNQFNALDGTGPNDVWLAGGKAETGFSGSALLMHWNGNNWSNIPVPQTWGGIGELSDVKVVRHNDIWVTGSNAATGNISVLRYDGTNWSHMTIPPYADHLEVKSSKEVYLTGFRIYSWDGANWKVQDSLNNHNYPVLKSSVVLPSGEIWAAGRVMNASNKFETLVYRQGAAVVNTINGIAAGQISMNVHPNPATGRFTLTVHATKAGTANLAISDLMGRVLDVKKVGLDEGVNNIPADLSGMAAGAYMIQLKTSGGSSNVRVMKQ